MCLESWQVQAPIGLISAAPPIDSGVAVGGGSLKPGSRESIPVDHVGSVELLDIPTPWLPAKSWCS